MAENNQVATTGQTGLAKLKSILNAPSVVEQFQNALAENKNLFIASIIDLYNGDKSLQECNPSTIVQECLKAAVLDLPINRALGFAYIVVYKNKVKQTDPQTGRTVEVKVPTPTFIPGYKGYIQLAMRTGQYRTINADVVYEGELQTANRLSGWKTQAWMTPGAKFDLTPENNLFLTPEEFGRRGQFYFGLSAFEGFEFTDAFTG